MKYLKLEDILSFVCNFYSVDVADVKGLKKPNEIVKARQVYSWIALRTTEHTQAAIGRVINRNHATILHGYNKIEEQSRIYPEIMREIEEIKSKLQPRNKMIVEEVDLLRLTENYTNSFIKL